jgi:hypothetical protein
MDSNMQNPEEGREFLKNYLRQAYQMPEEMLTEEVIDAVEFAVEIKLDLSKLSPDLAQKFSQGSPGEEQQRHIMTLGLQRCVPCNDRDPNDFCSRFGWYCRA